MGSDYTEAERDLKDMSVSVESTGVSSLALFCRVIKRYELTDHQIESLFDKYVETGDYRGVKREKILASIPRS